MAPPVDLLAMAQARSASCYAKIVHAHVYAVPSTMLGESILVIAAALCPCAVRYVGILCYWMTTGEHDAEL